MATEKIDKKKFVTHVTTEFERYEAFHSDRFAKCQDYYDLWKGKMGKKPQDWMNNIHVPMMIEAEQTITPRI